MGYFFAQHSQIRFAMLSQKPKEYHKNMQSQRFFGFLAVFSLFSLLPSTALADVPFSTSQAVVIVQCGNRQGSGVVINPEQGYVLTNAHVVEDVEHGGSPDPCEIGFVLDDSHYPELFYTATTDKVVFDESTAADFAILKIGQPEQRRTLSSFPYLKTDEFSKVGDPLSVISYPATAQGVQVVTTGTIQYLSHGILHTDTKISPGSSGGAGVNTENNLIGIAVGIEFEVVNGAEHVIGYELVDIRAVLDWLNTFGINVADLYVTHADPDRYHQPQAFITPENLSCSLLAKLADQTTVYCLKTNGSRAVFPNDTTYHSWFGDFSAVETVSPQTLASYTLTANVTMKPGTLIKIESDPKVYEVTDALGTIRWIQTETQARELFGDGWAGFVKDVPVSFFQNYTVGGPLPTN